VNDEGSENERLGMKVPGRSLRFAIKSLTMPNRQ